MQTEAAERRRQPCRARRGQSGQGRAEPRGTRPRPGRSSEGEITRLKEIIAAAQQKEKQGGERGRRAEQDDDEPGRHRSRGDGGRKMGEKEVRSGRPSSEGGDGGEDSGGLRRRVHQLEKDKLEMTSSHNQELCRLQAELTRLRSTAERGEAQRVELQYQLTVSQRDAERACQLSRDKHTLTEWAAQLQQTVQELQKVLDITRQAREEGQAALQQEVEERDTLIHSVSAENHRLHRLLQDQEEALKESERRTAEVQKEREREAEVKRRQTSELKYLRESEERSRREKEASQQMVKSLEASIEAERAAHLESKFNSEVIQLRLRDLEVVLAAERSGQQEAQRSLELLRAQFGEVERAYSLERERGDCTERALERLQQDHEQCKSNLTAALKTERKATSDLAERLEEEKRWHANTHTLLEQAAHRRRDAEEAFVNIRDTLKHHDTTGMSPPAKHDGTRSPADVLQLLKTTLSTCRHRQEAADKQVQDLLLASERLQEENQALQQLTSDQKRRMEESQQVSVKLEEEVARLRQESSDWPMQNRALQTELEREKEERKKEREEKQTEMQREREERKIEVQKLTEHFQKESKARLCFLYCVYQRLLAGCVVLNQPHNILGNFTWEELCNIINEQVDQVTSDLRNANDKVAQVQRVCEKKSACVEELQRSQKCVLFRLEESMRRREEAWSSQHALTVAQLQKELQMCRSQCDSLRDHTSSLQLRVSSLTSDLSRLQGFLSRSRRESSSFLSACALLAGTLRHAHRCLAALSEQKALLSRRLAERETLEKEVRRLAAALGGQEEEEDIRRRAVRCWRRSVYAVLALRKWQKLAGQPTVLFRVEVGHGRPAVGMCAGSIMTAQEDQISDDNVDGHLQVVWARWLRSKCLSSTILSSMADLQGALKHTGSSHPDVISASRSALSRLLEHLLNQSDVETSLDTLRPGQNHLTPPKPPKALVSTLQQHFLLFSQRLHSTEVERRSLRLEVTKLRKGLWQEKEEMVPAERFNTVCAELRQALSREQEAQTLLQEQTEQLHTLRLRANTHAAQQADSRHTLSRATQSLSEARQEVSRKERSIRILGKHLSGIQRERKQLEERLRQVEDELNAATRCRESLISNMKAAEMSYKEVRESLIQSRRSLSAQPRPLSLPRQHLEVSGEERVMGAPEMAACQSLLSSIAQLYQTCSSRIDWLEQEVSAHRSHVTALQDVCLRDNLAYAPVVEFTENCPLADVETPAPLPLPNLSKEPLVSVSTAPTQSDPAPSSSHSKAPRVKTKEKKAVRRNRGGRR